MFFILLIFICQDVYLNFSFTYGYLKSKNVLKMSVRHSALSINNFKKVKRMYFICITVNSRKIFVVTLFQTFNLQYTDKYLCRRSLSEQSALVSHKTTGANSNQHGSKIKFLISILEDLTHFGCLGLWLDRSLLPVNGVVADCKGVHYL